MKIVLCTDDPLIKASLEARLAGGVLIFLVSSPPRGRFFGGGDNHRKWWRGEIISASYLNSTIFMENQSCIRVAIE